MWREPCLSSLINDLQLDVALNLARKNVKQSSLKNSIFQGGNICSTPIKFTKY